MAEIKCDQCGELADINLYYNEQEVGEKDGFPVYRHSLTCPSCGADYFTHMEDDKTIELREQLHEYSRLVEELSVGEETPFVKKRISQLLNERSTVQFKLSTRMRQLAREFSPDDLDKFE